MLLKKYNDAKWMEITFSTRCSQGTWRKMWACKLVNANLSTTMRGVKLVECQLGASKMEKMLWIKCVECLIRSINLKDKLNEWDIVFWRWKGDQVSCSRSIKGEEALCFVAMEKCNTSIDSRGENPFKEVVWCGDVYAFCLHPQ